MASTPLMDTLEQASDLLEQIQSILNADKIDNARLSLALDAHHSLFCRFFEQEVQVSGLQKDLVNQHLSKMQGLLKQCDEHKSKVSIQLGTLKRSKKINKAYGK